MTRAQAQVNFFLLLGPGPLFELPPRLRRPPPPPVAVCPRPPEPLLPVGFGKSKAVSKLMPEMERGMLCSSETTNSQ